MYFGEYLVAKNVISEDDLSSGLNYQKSHRGQKLGEILIELDYISKDAMELMLESHIKKCADDISQDVKFIEEIEGSCSESYRFNDYRELVTSNDTKKILAVPVADDFFTLTVVAMANEKGIIDPILIGDEYKIVLLIKQHNLKLTNVKIIDKRDEVDAVEYALKLAEDGEAQIILRGGVSVEKFLDISQNRMKSVSGFKGLSNVCLYEMASFNKLIAVTDSLINKNPKVEKKIDIVKNSVEFMVGLGVDKPSVAVISFSDEVDPLNESSMDGAILAKMSERGQLGICQVDGPLTVQSAIDSKSEDDSVDIDILLVPSVDVANVLNWSFTALKGAKTASFTLGYVVPILLHRGVDDIITEENSIMLAAAMNMI